MSKAPAFQFYPGDWLRNSNLRRCSHAARGAWMDVLCLMHDADQYGVLRWPLADISQASGVPVELLNELAAKGVLKGGDNGCQEFVYRPRHAGKEGDPVTLVERTTHPCWYSSRFVTDEHVRMNRGRQTQFTTDNQPTGKPKGGLGERQGDGASTALASASALAVASTATSAKSQEQSATPPVADAPPLATGKARKPKAVGQRKPLMTIDEWLADCKAKDERTMPATDPIFEWAADAGIPVDYLRLAWVVFLRDWKAKKPQQDWRATYRNAVRQNWLKLWYFHADGDCRLTTTGEQERRAHE